jgi:hypothetical protein
VIVACHLPVGRAISGGCYSVLQKREYSGEQQLLVWCGAGSICWGPATASRLGRYLAGWLPQKLAFSRHSAIRGDQRKPLWPRGSPLRRSFGWCSCLPATTRNDGRPTCSRLFDASFGFQQGHRQSRKETMHAQRMIIV